MTKATRSNWRGRVLRYAPLILWIGVIFFLSGDQASMSKTSRFIRPGLEFLFPSATEETLLIYIVNIRKFAHFAEYAILAFFAARAFVSSSAQLLKTYWFAGSILLVLLIASVDETNQAFTSSRTGSAWDVLIDVIGSVVMILLVWKLQKRTRQ